MKILKNVWPLEEMQSSPSSHTGGGPLGMDINIADSPDLLSATVDVEVMFTENDTPRPIAAVFRKKKQREIRYC